MSPQRLSELSRRWAEANGFERCGTAAYAPRNTVAEQAKILKADRSNNELSCAKIASALPDVWPLVPPGKEAIRGVFQRMRSHLEQQGNLPPKRTDIIRSSQ